MGPSSITSSVKRSAITLGCAAMLQLMVPAAVSGQEAGLTDTRKSPFALLAPVGLEAGLKAGTHVGPPFHDGDFYKVLEAMIMVNALEIDPATEQFIDSVIAVIG